MNSERFNQSDRTSVWHPYTRHSSLDGAGLPIIVRGEGPYLFDSDGRRHLDAISSWWCCNLGHGHPALVSAIRKQAGELQHSILGNLSHPRATELASALAALLPGQQRKVLFASDGASAVEAALKIAIQYRHNTGEPSRNRFVSLEGAYHGDTIGAVSVGYQADFHAALDPLLFKSLRATAPFCAKCAFGLKPETCKTECFASMQQILDQYHDEITAVIVEPLCQGAAGMRIYAPSYLARLSEHCRHHNILLIVDEIAVGMGRTGRMFAFEHAAIEPDIVCMGKALSGGYLPLSATAVTREIYDSFSDKPNDHTFYNGHTFAGNPIACASALATLEVYKGEYIVAKAAELGTILAREMTLLSASRGVSGARTLGMIAAFETKSAPELAIGLRRKHGILIRPLGNTVYLMLPLIVDEDLLVNTVRLIREELQCCMSS
ncbi:MAG: adenosylmethionine--8-amino-7-oxononanoate transaminase [Lentisphaerales bacterium]|nr:MAG: adenosylmethionine--8-amino-7-oxononanoate transaminase [Lentisphaerales bacterium]